mgnify:CR=1 FL=1
MICLNYGYIQTELHKKMQQIKRCRDENIEHVRLGEKYQKTVLIKTIELVQ